MNECNHETQNRIHMELERKDRSADTSPPCVSTVRMCDTMKAKMTNHKMSGTNLVLSAKLGADVLDVTPADRAEEEDEKDPVEVHTEDRPDVIVADE